MKLLLAHPLTLILLLAPNLAPGSVIPTSLALRWGVGKEARSDASDLAHEPSVSATWPMGRKVVLWSDIGYSQETIEPSQIRIALSSSGNPRDRYYDMSQLVKYQNRFVPVTFGLRAYLRDNEQRSRGLFLEGGPTATFASYMDQDRDSRFALLGGFRAGLGVRFAGVDGSRGEVGMSYYLAEAFGQHPGAVGRIGTPGEADVQVFGAYVAVGFGD